MKVKIAIIISGRGSNMEAIAQSVECGILRDSCQIAVVICNREGAQGIERAQDLGLPRKIIPSVGLTAQVFEEALVATLKPFSIDWVVLAGFNRILSPYFIDLYRGRIVNIHPADTLLYQGPHGYKWAFDLKKTETKITVHLVDQGVDTGPVIDQEIVDLRGAQSLAEVTRRGLLVEHELYPQALKKVFLNTKSENENNLECVE